MKKIAIPSEGSSVAGHFGRCPEYTIVETEDKKVIRKKVIPNPGHEPGFLPRYLKNQGIDCIVAGGMGRRAKELFDSNGIEVVTGARGSIEKVIRLYLEDKLNTEGNICDH